MRRMHKHIHTEQSEGYAVWLRKFFQRGPNFDNVFFSKIVFLFLVYEGGAYTTTRGPSSVFRWRADDGLTLYSGLIAL